MYYYGGGTCGCQNNYAYPMYPMYYPNTNSNSAIIIVLFMRGIVKVFGFYDINSYFCTNE